MEKAKLTDKLRDYSRERIPLVKDIFFNFFQDIKGERVTVSAGHLAYVSLLSLVPFIMVIFTVMSAFPAFGEMKTQVEELIFSNFVPHAGEQVQSKMTEFVGNASSMSAVGIFGLIIVALLLIGNIDKAFNHLWKTKNQRPLIFTFAIYWMIITLGPMLIGVSIAVSSYLGAIATFADDYTPGFGTLLLKTVPWAAAIGAFLILYMIVPNRPVRAKYAFWGALFATILFEISKQGFAFYLKNFPSYEAIYGALAAVPILFLWVYLSWIVVLLGAILTFSITRTCESRDEDTEADAQEQQQEAEAIGAVESTQGS